MPAKDIVKAKLEYQDGRERILVLVQVEPTVFRWKLAACGTPWDGVDYVDKATAISQLRVEVECDKQTFKDLTVIPIEPGPAERAAARVADYCSDLPQEQDDLTRIINEETNIEELADATNSLVAYCFRNRPQFARALFPVTAAGAPRDLTFDGLLLAVVEAMGKTMQQDFDNLKKILLEPVSTIQMASKLPPGGRVQ